MGMHTMFGDGSEIPLSDVSHVKEIVHKNMVFDRWRKGDLLMIDNFRVSHGRQVSIPTLIALRIIAGGYSYLHRPCKFDNCI